MSTTSSSGGAMEVRRTAAQCTRILVSMSCESQVVKVITEAHEGEIVSLAYNKTRREIFSAADGDKVIKVGRGFSQFCCMACF